MNNSLTPDNDSWDQDYANGRWDFLEEDARELARHALIANYCRCHDPEGRILDLGCGTGVLCDYLDRKQKYKYVGVDISSVAISRAKEKFNLKFKCSDALSFSPAGKFDIIIFNEVLYYTDFEAVLKKYCHVLKPDGIFIISIYRKQNNFDNIWQLISQMFHAVEVIELTVGNHASTVTWNIKIATLPPTKP